MQKVGAFRPQNWIYIAISLRFFGGTKYFIIPKNFIPTKARFFYGLSKSGKSDGKIRHDLATFGDIWQHLAIFGTVGQNSKQIGQYLTSSDRIRNSLTFFDKLWHGSARFGKSWQNLTRLTSCEICCNGMTRFGKIGKIPRHLARLGVIRHVSTRSGEI